MMVSPTAYVYVHTYAHVYIFILWDLCVNLITYKNSQQRKLKMQYKYLNQLFLAVSDTFFQLGHGWKLDRRKMFAVFSLSRLPPWNSKQNSNNPQQNSNQK
jgi:hypothetical protein